MKLVKPPHPPGGGENLIPLINVVFLMLIFFMVIGRIAPADLFEVKPPASSSGTALEPEVIKVLIAADGRLALDGEIVSVAELGELMAQRLGVLAKNEQISTPVITLKADAEVTAQQLSGALAALRSAGAAKVTLLTARGG